MAFEPGFGATIAAQTRLTHSRRNIKMADEVLSQFQQAKAEAAVDTTKKLKVGIIGTG